MSYANSDYRCDHCGKIVDPEGKHTVSNRDDTVFCDVECEENYQADRAAFRADHAHDEARDR